MADLQENSKMAEMAPNYNAVNSTSDPKNMQELTQFVSILFVNFMQRYPCNHQLQIFT